MHWAYGLKANVFTARIQHAHELDIIRTYYKLTKQILSHIFMYFLYVCLFFHSVLNWRSICDVMQHFNSTSSRQRNLQIFVLQYL